TNILYTNLVLNLSDTSWPLESCNKCLWCFATNNCTDYPVTWLFPPASVCKLADARWGVCWCELSYLLLIFDFIQLSLFIKLKIRIVCDCPLRLDREDEQYARRREESRQRSEER
uniref:PTTG1 interacting protein n=1 Tax=Periophthalmus magnuspinnatus TaxID=409849 RepID=A0A3B4ADJ6_9GOBI